MATLTAEALHNLRADIGDLDTPQAFSDPELAHVWSRAGGDGDAAARLARRQLLNSAAKLADYTAGLSTEKRDQVFQHLRVLVERDDRIAPSVPAMGVGTLARAGMTATEWGA